MYPNYVIIRKFKKKKKKVGVIDENTFINT